MQFSYVPRHARTGGHSYGHEPQRCRSYREPAQKRSEPNRSPLNYQQPFACSGHPSLAFQDTGGLPVGSEAVNACIPVEKETAEKTR